MFVFMFVNKHKHNKVHESVNYTTKKTRIYTVLKILKVMSLYTYSETFIYVSLIHTC